MSHVLAKSLPWFDQWLAATGEQPPDFSAMPSIADLPPLLEFADGSAVSSVDDWPARCDEIREQLDHWFFGRTPAQPPALVESTVLAEEREGGVIRRKVELTFDTQPRVSITIETMVPEGDGPFPIFMTQTTHRAWAGIGVSRGYATCLCPGADADDQSDRFVPLYPACDWARIPRRAWLCSRALDYMLTLPNVIADQVAITGHSRNGKQSLIAAAYDPRFTAVVSSSSCAAGATPYRFVSENTFEESVEFTTNLCPDWFHPRLRFFTGREDKLPVDIHGLYALIAPRPCLIGTAINDGCETTFAIERGYLEGRDAYRLLGKGDNFRIDWRTGGHETNAQTVHRYFDWFDKAFDRPGGDAFDFPEKLLHAFDFGKWHASPAARVTAPAKADSADAAAIRERIRWLLGDAPPRFVEWGGSYGSEKPHDEELMGRSWVPDGIAKKKFQFSDYVSGDLYMPSNAHERGAPLPVVIWLHPWSYSTGYSGAYMEGPRVYHALASQGFAVVAFDQLGFGRRIEEGRDFYLRYPQWSKLGRMVRDVSAAVDFLHEGDNRFDFVLRQDFVVELPPLDLDHVYCLGYALGGMVGMLATALDDRIAGVASFAGFTPLRTDTSAKPTGGNRRLFDWHGLCPRLGLFEGREADVPFDYDDVLRLIAPRHTLIVAPTHDREADVEDVRACVDRARPAWTGAKADHRLTFMTPHDYSRFQSDQHRLFQGWWQRCVVRAGMDPVE